VVSLGLFHLLEKFPSGRSSAILPTLTAAGEEDDDHAEEQHDHRCQCSPHTNRVVGMRTTTVGIDVVLDDLYSDALEMLDVDHNNQSCTYAERSKIDCHYHQCNYPCHGSNHGRNCTAYYASECAKTSNESETARNRMQHKCVRECVSAVGASAAEGCVVDLLHDHGGLVADHFGVAKVLVGPGVMRIS